MNTRLQVEHPITEAITGLDLVEQMLRVAAGRPLGLRQEEVSQPKGWAVECRVYAEDPARGFLPSIGRLTRYAEPRGEGVRVDSGVEEGSEVSVHYDPLLAKLVGAGPDRATALARAARALDAYVIRGVQHNAPLLRAVLDAPDFVAGDFSTAFLAEHFPAAEASAPARLPLAPRREAEVLALAAALRVWHDLRLAGGAARGQAAALGAERRLVVTDAAGRQVAVAVRPARRGAAAPPAAATIVQLGSSHAGEFEAPALEVELAAPGRMCVVALRPGGAGAGDGASPLVEAEIDGAEALCQVIARAPRRLTLQYCGAQRTLVVDSPAAAARARHMLPPLAEDFSKLVRSPMPGTLVAVKVAVGDAVEAGDEIAVVEAMKMRNVLRAAAAGRIAAVAAAAGASVAADQVIARLE